VAEASAYYGLPEGQRGIFVGGGGSARIPRLIGVARMTDLMMTGRVLDADEGAAWACRSTSCRGRGAGQGAGAGQKIAGNAPMSNFAVMHALPRIADQSQSEGLFTESLMAAVAESTPEAQDRLRAFLEGRAGKVVKHHERAEGPLPRRRVGGCVEAGSMCAPTAPVILRSTEPLRWFPTA
jgi:enoyl-CoA hydratase/carnithine racemase